MVIRRAILLLPALCLVIGARAQRMSMQTVDIDTVTVVAKRTLTGIGVQKTVLDTLALRGSVGNSLADVLAQSTSIFIKSYGRATLSTASFRGTAPSHTQVSWNGMKLNSPMLGMVDFSMIPAYFIDDANLYHGASSVGVTGGGLGGAITLTTKSTQEKGPGLCYIQGIGSFNTFDQFLRATYSGLKWQSSTRVYYTTSDNDFRYTNIHKKNYITGTDGEITGFTRPVERNKNGAFNDFHLLQEFYYNTGRGSRWGLSAWYLDSKRGVPMLDVDYRTEGESTNRQHEQTFRSTLGWEKISGELKLSARGGYTYTDMLYVYRNSLGNGNFAEGTRSVSYVHTGLARFEAEYYLGNKWMFTANIAGYQHFVRSMDRSVVSSDGERRIVGFDKSRTEVSAFASARYKPAERWGLAVNVRQELYGNKFTPVIPAAFAEYLVSKRGAVTVKASAARNFRYPSLNDLYFMPGGNDTLRPERGFTYDGGVEFSLKSKRLGFRGEVTAFDSYVHDWIVWLPTVKGFWSPRNVKEVRSYGMEFKGRFTADPGDTWNLMLDGNYAITHSVNHGDPVNWADQSIGKQLVYIPVYSGALTGRAAWRRWALTYKWNYYSERFATSDNEVKTKVWRISPYYMNDVSLEKSFAMRWAGLSLKVSVNNLFDEAYESVLSRPMPGRSYGFFIEITPRFRRK